MLHVFTPPPGLEWSRPRAVRLSAAGRGMAIGAIAMALAGPAAGYAMFQESRRQTTERQQIIDHPALAAGIITKLTKDSKDSNSGTVHYAFDAEGQHVSGKMRIRRSWWRELTIGEPLTIRYAEGAPAINAPDGTLPRVLPVWLSGLIGGVLLGIAALFAAILRADLRLLSEGRIAEGTVREIKVSRSQHGTHRSMRYDFASMSGVRVTGKAGASKTTPGAGSPIVVIYDPDNPKRNKPYPFALVEPARS
jgi:hypothetical protein